MRVYSSLPFISASHQVSLGTQTPHILSLAVIRVGVDVARQKKLRKAFSKFYRRHYELISKFNVGLKSLLHQGLSEPEFYGDLVYKFKKIRGMTDFSDRFRKIIMRYKRIGYNLNVMRQSACLTQSRLIAMLHSLIARRWIGRQTP